jgi:arabinan endo-1,5-alpha-L-arabinosidase
VPGHVRGPGHNSVVTTPAGTDVLVYHAWDEAGENRQMCIDVLEWTPEGPTTPGPSWTEQPAPV